jgi:hypothetical protein
MQVTPCPAGHASSLQVITNTAPSEFPSVSVHFEGHSKSLHYVRTITNTAPSDTVPSGLFSVFCSFHANRLASVA